MKQIFLNTFVGHFLLSFRDKYDLLRLAVRRDESIGTVVNDQMALNIAVKICQSDKLFIDVGAHIGSVISMVKRQNKNTKIIAIEAMPDKARLLRKKFSDVEVVECAVGDSEGEVEFFVNIDQSGYSSLIDSGDRESENIKRISVQMKRMDDIIPHEMIGVIKIDVEGAELGVLRGGECVLQQSRPVIMFESGPIASGDGQFSKDAMWSFLNSHDYQIVIPNRMAHLDDGLSLDGFLESHLYPRRTTNYFGVPKEYRTEVRDRVRHALGMR